MEEKKQKEEPKQIFDTHKFLFTLFYENRIKGHTIIYLNRDGKEEETTIDKIDIGASPISCKIYDEKGTRHIIPFLRIRKIFLNKELVWDATGTDLSNVKIIKAYQKNQEKN